MRWTGGGREQVWGWWEDPLQWEKGTVWWEKMNTLGGPRSFDKRTVPTFGAWHQLISDLSLHPSNATLQIDTGSPFGVISRMNKNFCQPSKGSDSVGCCGHKEPIPTIQPTKYGVSLPERPWQSENLLSSPECWLESRDGKQVKVKMVHNSILMPALSVGAAWSTMLRSCIKKETHTTACMLSMHCQSWLDNICPFT